MGSGRQKNNASVSRKTGWKGEGVVEGGEGGGVLKGRGGGVRGGVGAEPLWPNGGGGGGGVFGKATILSSSVVRLGASGWLCLIRDFYQCFGMMHRPTLGRGWWLGGGGGVGGGVGGGRERGAEPVWPNEEQNLW